ncbi:hypothetical protein F4821DRAFT_263889 [Hypoxylon rubiginosum]|uniref:Uncharacterized protein n=1 Tax=Hypoxylon rubiginosum TaxID=110542 RepID=A0ACC0CQ08_9PEZI|nr:hypothetical protein F4821DRAFT_263889 [Hypoxylon rubiginosum]
MADDSHSPITRFVKFPIVDWDSFKGNKIYVAQGRGFEGLHQPKRTKALEPTGFALVSTKKNIASAGEEDYETHSSDDTECFDDSSEFESESELDESDSSEDSDVEEDPGNSVYSRVVQALGTSPTYSLCYEVALQPDQSAAVLKPLRNVTILQERSYQIALFHKSKFYNLLKLKHVEYLRL